MSGELRGWDAADDERDERRWAGMTVEDDEPFRTPPRPAPPATTPVPEGPRCTARNSNHGGSRRLPWFCGALIGEDGRCERGHEVGR